MRQITKDEERGLESMIDTCGLAAVLHALGAICNEKAEHVRSAWGDRILGRLWDRAATIIDKASASEYIDHLSR